MRVIHKVNARIFLEQNNLRKQEAETVEPRQKYAGDDILDTLFTEAQIFGAHNGRVDQIQSHSVRTVFVNHDRGVREVAQRLAHLFTVGRQHKTRHNQVFPWGLTKQMRAEDQQRIEPTTRLVKTFRNKVGRETAHKGLLVFEGIMSLGVGHTTRFKPAIEHFFNTTQRALALT